MWPWPLKIRATEVEELPMMLVCVDNVEAIF